MMYKVLIAEDHESTNISLQRTLEELNILDADYTYYCDDALQKTQLAVEKNAPYDLLITDLYFEDDGRPQKISGGEALITELKRFQPALHILVFSAESRASIIDNLFTNLDIDGFVRKARNDAKELKLAIESLFNNQRYLPRQIAQHIKQNNTHDFTVFDITIISLMAKGMRQKDIPGYLKKQQIRPSGLSSIEKRLNQIKEALNFSNNEQLVAYCKDMGIV
jgi:two-component system capsular synthesis response regulator RcsB